MNLGTLALTNDESALVNQLMHFVLFVRRESAPVPESAEDFDKLLTRYIQFIRKERLTLVRKLIRDGKV